MRIDGVRLEREDGKADRVSIRIDGDWHCVIAAIPMGGEEVFDVGPAYLAKVGTEDAYGLV